VNRFTETHTIATVYNPHRRVYHLFGWAPFICHLFAIFYLNVRKQIFDAFKFPNEA